MWLKCRPDLAVETFEDGVALVEWCLARSRQQEEGGRVLVLLDQVMPGLDGLSAARLLRQTEAALQTRHKTRIVMVSAAVHSLASPDVDDFMQKPVQIPQLESLIRTLLAKN